MKNQQGFIQIPILIAIFVGLLVVGGGGYVGLSKYQAAKEERINAEIETRNQVVTQKLALDQAQAEIEKLKKENSSTTETLNEHTQVVEKTQFPVTPSTNVSTVEKPKTVASSNITTPPTPIAVAVPVITPAVTTPTPTSTIVPPPPPPPSVPTPTVVTPTLSITGVSVLPTQNSAHIEWTTSSAANSKIFYWRDTGTKLVEQSLAGLGLIHFVDLKNLAPGITYYFTVEAVSVTGITQTQNGSFSTIDSTISAKKKTIYSTDDWSISSTGEAFEVKAITISATGLNLREKMYDPGINLFNNGGSRVVFWACEGLDNSIYPCPGIDANTPEALQDANLTMGFLADSAKSNAVWDPIFIGLHLNFSSGAKIEFIKAVGVESGKVVCLTETSIPVGLTGTADCSANVLIPN